MIEQASQPGVLSEPIVLVVDDDPGVLAALSTLLVPRLEPLFRVESVASAEEAFELVASLGQSAEAPLALVISDEKMPGASGTDLLVGLRQDASHRHGGRIIITGYAGLESAKRAINEAEVDRYFPKPWDTEKALLPAIASILSRFLQKSGLDHFLVSSTAEDDQALAALREVRREWWAYLTLADDDAESRKDEPSFEEAEDEGAIHFLVERVSPRGRRPAGCLRFRSLAASTWFLDGLSFWPEEVSDELETLLLRSALLHAQKMGISTIHTLAPILRSDVYEALGFVAVSPKAAGQFPELFHNIPTGAVAMQANTMASPDAFAQRYMRDQKLCHCAQTQCVARDYGAERRRYFCPLDFHEGRVPAGFPAIQTP